LRAKRKEKREKMAAQGVHLLFHHRDTETQRYREDLTMREGEKRGFSQ